MLTHGKIMNFLTTTQTKKHLTSLCFRKEIKKFSLRSREFSGKTVESTVTKKEKSHEII